MKRQPRRWFFRPRTEGLESRLVLNSDVGVNLDVNSTTAGNPIWVDVHNLAAPWGTFNNAGAANPKLTLTPDNYPLANALTFLSLANYPDGDYQLSYTGSATVTFSGVGQLAGPVTTGVNGVTTGTVVVNHDLGNQKALYINVSNINPSNPLDNFHLYTPGYGSNPTQMFTNAFLHQLQPFSTIRFMQWDLTTGSKQTTWQSRTPPNSFVVTAPNAVPWEDMIELANEAQKDMWINVPALATPNYIQNLAQLVAAKLDPNLHVYVEYGNENWNTGWPQHQQILQAAQANPMVPQAPGQALRMIADQSAYQMVQIAGAFDQAFSANPAQFRPVLAGWTDNSNYQSQALQYIQQNYGSPSQYLWGMAVDAYISLPDGGDTPGLTLNQLFARLNSYLTTTFTPAIKTNAALAQSYGLTMVAYEGGQSLFVASGLNATVKQLALSDPRMDQLYVSLLNVWNQVGGGVFEQYTLSSQYGYWGMVANALSPGSQEWNAVMSQILPLGDANLDGTVDYSDFQTLQANYGATNAFWDQGDFNDDGVVNWSDLNIQRENLDPAEFTLSQFAQDALFGQPSTIVPSQTSEYDGYGVTYASDLPFVSSSSGSGSVQRDGNSLGNSIVLGGLAYPKGLGLVANSSIVIALDGQSARFESTIGVDGSSNSSSSVVFSVYGDGSLLYQSSTVTFASGGIPIDVNVTGVTTLKLVVTSAPSSIPANDHAVWAAARLVSTQNFGATTPYSLTWQLSRNSTVLSTQTTDSFIFGSTVDGVYTLSLTVVDGNGNSATASETITVGPVHPTGLTVYAGNQQAELDWYLAGSSLSYVVYRSTSPNPSTMVAIANGLTKPKFIDTGLTNGTTYYYELASVDSNGLVGPPTLVHSAMPTILQSVDTYVGDMTFLPATTGPVVRNRSDVPDSFGDGQTMPLNVSGNLYVKGLGVQANSTVAVALNGGYTNFLVTIGVDSSAPGAAAVTFQVVADGTVLYTSPTKTSATGFTHLNLNVAGRQVLKLVVQAVGSSATGDYADWGNALLTPAHVIDATTLPLQAQWAWGPIGLETNALGGPIVINGVNDQQGVGSAAVSSGLKITLNHHYATFTATIGVDTVLGSLSSVYFQVQGDGRTLYTSPLMTVTTAAIPIAIPVATINTLNLIVLAGSSISPNLDYADWGLAALHT